MIRLPVSSVSLIYVEEDKIKKYRLKDWTVIPDLNQVTDQDKRFEVEPKAMKVLQVLIEHAGQIVSRDKLMSLVWEQSIVTDNSVDRAIARLRKLLGDNAKTPEFIATVSKKGYRLVAPVEQIPVITGEKVSEPVASISSTTVKPLKYGTIQFFYAGVFLLALTLILVYTNQGLTTVPNTYVLKQAFPSKVGPEYSLALPKEGRQRAFIWVNPDTQIADVYAVQESGETVQLTFTEEEEQSVDIHPNGSQVAFVRYFETGLCAIYIVNVIQGDEKHIADCGYTHLSKVKWAADGQSLFFVGRDRSAQPFSLYSYVLATGKLSQLTNGMQGTFGDYQLAISDNGKKLAYLRSERWSHSQIRILDLETGVDNLRFESPQMLLDLNWDIDDESLLTVMGANFNQLVRVDIDGGAKSIHTFLNRMTEPQIANDLADIVVRESFQRKSIYHQSWLQEHPQDTNLFSSTRNQWHPAYSPSGEQIAYLSDETGTVEVWLYGKGGSNRQLTHNQLRGISQIKWSPNEDYLLLDSDNDGLYRLTIKDGELLRYTSDQHYAKNPSWHSDSEGIIFTSDMSGDWQLWYQKGIGKEPQKITTDGGFTGRVSANGEHLLYTKFYQAGVWQKKVNDLSGPGEKIIEKIQPGISNQWQVSESGIFFAKHMEGELKLLHHTFSEEQEIVVASIPHVLYLNFSFSVNEELGELLYSRTDHSESDFVLLKK